MPVKWLTTVLVAALAVALAACTPSPEQFQPTDPLAGASGVVVHIGGCSPAVDPCQE